jgi:hypothetical protein
MFNHSHTDILVSHFRLFTAAEFPAKKPENLEESWQHSE